MNIYKQFFKMGLHIGNAFTSSDKTPNRFIAGYRNKKAVLDLHYSAQSLKQIYLILQAIVIKKGSILIIEPNKKLFGSIKKISHSYNCHYYVGAYVTGLISNYSSMTETLIAEKGNRVIANIGKLPNLLIIRDSRWGQDFLKEARYLGIPTITTIDNSTPLKNCSYVFPGNVKSYKASLFFYTFIDLCLKKINVLIPVK